jgi:integrase
MTVQLKLVAPMPAAPVALRRPNQELRTREYLTEAEVEKLLKAVRKNRWGHRDSTMILVAYRHGLRVSELIDLRWDQIDFRSQARDTKHASDIRRGVARLT